MPTRRRPQTTPSGAHKSANLSDRLEAAAAAKKVALARFQARPAPDDPVVKAQQAARKAISDARDHRAAERKAAREADLTRQAAERAAQAADQAAQEAEQRRLAAEAADREAAVEADRKATRDARYAARKARQR